MNGTINLIAFGTFGNPNGFKQSFFVGNHNIATHIKTFDLKTEAIQLFPKSTVYSIRKEALNKLNIIAYSIYTFAKEQGSDRGGTFIGSSLLFVNGIADESITISNLNEFHTNLCKKNVQNDVILANHSDQLAVSKPKDFDKVAYNLRQIEVLNFASTSNKNLVVYSNTKPENLKQLFVNALDLLNVYDTIYFTSSNEIAEFVHKKGIFKLVQKEGFESEIQQLNQERRLAMQSTIAEFENEKLSIEEKKKKATKAFKQQIDLNEKQHVENKKKIDSSKTELNAINQQYDSFLQKINETIVKLKSGQKLEKAMLGYTESKQVFVSQVYKQDKPKPLEQIETTTLKLENSGNQTSQSKRRSSRSKSSSQLFDFKLVSGGLLVLWLGTLAYFLVFSKKNQQSVVLLPTPKTAIIPKPAPRPTPAITPTEIALMPLPNNELIEHDRLLVSKGGIKGKKIRQIVEIIFSQNPTEIAGVYSNQKVAYQQALLKQNKACFTKIDNDYILSCEQLSHVPTFKKK